MNALVIASLDSQVWRLVGLDPGPKRSVWQPAPEPDRPGDRRQTELADRTKPPEDWLL